MKSAVTLLLVAVLLSRAACAADLVEGTAFVIDGETLLRNPSAMHQCRAAAPPPKI
jgi:hypothetical protein